MIILGIYKYFVLSFIVNFAAVSVCAADIGDVIRITIYTSASQITFGDSLSLFCEITAPQKYEIPEPFPEDQSSDYEIPGQPERLGSPDSGSDITTYRFLVYAFAPDTLSIGPFAAEYIDADGTSGTVRSNVIEIPVNSVIESVESPQLPNRDPIAVKSAGVSIWLILILCLLAALCAAAVFYYIRKKRTTPVPEIVEPVDEIEEFLRLKDLKLYESGYLKELYVQVSLKMRGFLNRNLEFDALNDTTGEIAHELSNKYGNKQVIDNINRILEESDSVKYAKYAPPFEQSTTVIDRALEPVKTILDEIARRKKEEEEAAEAKKSAGHDPDSMTKSESGMAAEHNREDT